MKQPGERVRAIASQLLPTETMERVIDPIVADLQCEYGDALVRGAVWRARLSLLRSYLGLAGALSRLGLRHVCDPRMSNAGSELARTWIVSVLALCVLTVALVIPALTTEGWWEGDVLFGALLSVTFIPQALPMSIPGGLCVGVLWATRGKTVTRRRLCTILALALAFTALVWTVLEWMMPQANQLFREMVAARIAVGGPMPTLEPGLSELGLSRLGQRTDPAAVRQYHLLWGLCFAAAPLSLFAFGLAGYVRRATSAVALAIALSISYFACIALLASVAPEAAPFAKAWMPNLVLLVLAGALLLRPSARRAF